MLDDRALEVQAEREQALGGLPVAVPLDHRAHLLELVRLGPFRTAHVLQDGALDVAPDEALPDAVRVGPCRAEALDPEEVGEAAEGVEGGKRGVDLLADLVHGAHDAADPDLEAVALVVAKTQATLRPEVLKDLDAGERPEAFHDPAVVPRAQERHPLRGHGALVLGAGEPHGVAADLQHPGRVPDEVVVFPGGQADPGGEVLAGRDLAGTAAELFDDEVVGLGAELAPEGRRAGVEDLHAREVLVALLGDGERLGRVRTDTRVAQESGRGHKAPRLRRPASCPRPGRRRRAPSRSPCTPSGAPSGPASVRPRARPCGCG